MRSQDLNRYDEMFRPDGTARSAYAKFQDWYAKQDPAWLRRQDKVAEMFFRRSGITFNVYSDKSAEERLIPFDMIPRIISGRDWRKVTRGIEQRVRAINAFLQDLYHRQEIVRSGRLPVEMLQSNDAFLAQMVGFTPPGAV